MARVRTKDTAPEVALRSALFRRGLRYRKNVRSLFGKPDIVFYGSRVAVFVDGRFWHGYDLGATSALSEWWRAKIERNVRRDLAVGARLEADGWSVVRVSDAHIERELEGVVNAIAALVHERRASRAAVLQGT